MIIILVNELNHPYLIFHLVFMIIMMVNDINHQTFTFLSGFNDNNDGE